MMQIHIRPPIPAVQLKSVAARYRPSLRPRGAVWGSAGGRRWRFAATPEDRGDDAPEDQRLARLEAILFLAREPLSSRKLSQYANLADGTEARTLVRQLNEMADESGRAFRVEEVAGGYQMLTRPQYSPWLRRLEHASTELRLSPPAMETLAVVAYRQPVMRADVEAVRGVSCGEMLRQLMERELVRISGRSEELGRPYLYSTTKRFLQVFGLRSLDALPRPAGLEKTPPAPEDDTDIPSDILSAEGD